MQVKGVGYESVDNFVRTSRLHNRTGLNFGAYDCESLIRKFLYSPGASLKQMR